VPVGAAFAIRLHSPHIHYQGHQVQLINCPLLIGQQMGEENAGGYPRVQAFCLAQFGDG
jgi:hypothetical protein